MLFNQNPFSPPPAQVGPTLPVDSGRVVADEIAALAQNYVYGVRELPLRISALQYRNDLPVNDHPQARIVASPIFIPDTRIGG